MKKTARKIGQKLLLAVLFLAGMVAFLAMIGEPTAEWYENANELFGKFSVVWLIAEKALLGLFICLLVKVAERVNPELFGKVSK